MKNVLIIGATSAIARASASIFATQGCRLLVVARNTTALSELAATLHSDGAAAVDTLALDLNGTDAGARCLTRAREWLNTVDLLLICHGTLPDQQRCEHDPECVRNPLQDNALSTISLLCHLAPLMRDQGHGGIAVISSVAGERGRASNYIYGSAKAAVICYLQGLRASLHGSGVNVLDIRPGLIDTPMTARFNKGRLWSSPERVARDIERALRRQRHTLYTPWFWRWIMLVIRMLPESVSKRLRF